MLDNVRSGFLVSRMIHWLVVIFATMCCIVGMSSMSEVEAEPVVLSNFGCNEPSCIECEYYIDLLHDGEVIEKNLKISVIKEWEYDYVTVTPYKHTVQTESGSVNIYFKIILEREDDGWDFLLNVEDASGETSSHYSARVSDTTQLDEWDVLLSVGAKNHYRVIFESGLEMNLEVKVMSDEVTVKKISGVEKDRVAIVSDTTYEHDGVTDTIDFIIAERNVVWRNNVKYSFALGIDKVVRSGTTTSDVTDEYKVIKVCPLDEVVTCKKNWSAVDSGKVASVELGTVVKFRLTSRTNDDVYDTVLIDTVYVQNDVICNNNLLKVSLDGKNYCDSVVTKEGYNISASTSSSLESSYWILRVTGCPISTDAYTDFSVDNVLIYNLRVLDDDTKECREDSRQIKWSKRCYTFKCDEGDLITFTIDNETITVEDQDQWVGDDRKYSATLQLLKIYDDFGEEHVVDVSFSTTSKISITVPLTDKIIGEFKIHMREISKEGSYTFTDYLVNFVMKVNGSDDITYSFDGLPYIGGFKIIEC